jgi:hypothetical protein
MKLLFTIFLCISSIFVFAQSETNNFITYDTSIAYTGPATGGSTWLLRITRPSNYFTANNADTASRLMIVNMNGSGQVGTDTSNLTVYGPHYWLENGWNGSVVLGNGTHYPIWITIMPQGLNVRPYNTVPLLLQLMSEFHPRGGKIGMIGFSMGNQCLGWALIDSTAGVGTNYMMSRTACVVDLEGENASTYGGNYEGNFPYSYGVWAKRYGGKFFGEEGNTDPRNVWQNTQQMNDSLPGSGFFTYQNDQGGGHCCWNDLQSPNVPNWQNITVPYGNSWITTMSTAPNTAGNYIYSATTGTNVYQWMVRAMPDTSLVGGCAPIVNAGSNQNIQLPTTTVSLSGSVTASCSYSISSEGYSEVSGPNSATITPTNSVTGTASNLIAGTYVFQLKGIDNHSNVGVATVTITVSAEQSPTVSAGSNQTIQLPLSSTTVVGTSSGNGGATISSNVWSQTSGPVTANIVQPDSLTTSITSMTVAGTYTFTLTTTDNNSNSAHSSVTVTVTPSGTVNVRPVLIVGPGEYQSFLINLSGQIYGIGDNLATLGVGNTGTAGLPLPLVGATGVTLPPFKNVWGGLHGGCEIDSLGRVFCQGDNSNGALGQGNNSLYGTAMQITRDSTGNPFNNVVQLSSIYVGGSTGSQGWVAVKSNGTMWIWGQLAAGSRGNGTDSTHADSTTYYPVQVIIPGNRLVAKVQGGAIIIVLCTDGTVWTWTRPGFTQDLGYAWTGTQYQTPHQIASGMKDIAGGSGINYAIDSAGNLWGWGSWATSMGQSGSSGRGTPWTGLQELTTLQSHLDGPIAQIGVNYVATYILTTKGSLFAHGDNAQGNIGTGSEINFNDSSSTQSPYAWNFNINTLLVQYPTKILSGIQAFFTSQPFLFYTYAEDSLGNLYTWGRNKGGVLGNGIIACSAGNGATYPNGWDITTPTKVYPFNLLYVIKQAVPWCIIYPNGTPCNQCTNTTNPGPTITISGGTTQNFPSTTTSINLISSATPYTGLHLAKNIWSQVSGPTSANFTAGGASTTAITGLLSGTYVFSVQYWDSNDETTTQNITVNVSSSSTCNNCYIMVNGSVLSNNRN